MPPSSPRDSHLGIHVAIGVSGAGKTWGVKAGVFRAVHSGLKVIVLDRMREWNAVPQAIRAKTATARTSREAIELMKRRSLVILHVPPNMMEQAADQICQWARDNAGGVALPEAHRVAPVNRPLIGSLEELATAWRHHRAALWADTQRFALLNKTIIENSRDTKLYAIVGNRDLMCVRELGGSDLESKVRQAAQRLEHGQPGWHVALGASRLPPYELVR